MGALGRPCEAALGDAAWRDALGRPAQVRWSRAVADEILRRTAEGETLRGICRAGGEAGRLPGFRAVVKWLEDRPAFREEMAAARAAAGGPIVGRPSGYCVETAEAICRRLAAGEGVVAICRDPTMPSAQTVYRWRAERPEFDAALRVARDLAGEAIFEESLAICAEVTPKTARACEVRLRHLRWAAGKLAPRKYGLLKSQAAEGLEAPAGEAGGAGESHDGDRGEREGGGAAARGGLTVILKKFIFDKETPEGRFEDGPGELLYTMTPEQVAGNIEGEHPGVTAWKARQAALEASRAAAGGGGDASAGRPDDPEGWL